MTDSRIRAILSGLKGEIRRDTDRERVRRLCIMGMHWNQRLIEFTPEIIIEEKSAITCKSCKEIKPDNAFTWIKVPYRQSFYFYPRKICKACVNESRRKKTVRKPEKGPKFCPECRQFLSLKEFSSFTNCYTAKGGSKIYRVYRRNSCKACTALKAFNTKRLKQYQALTLSCG